MNTRTAAFRKTTRNLTALLQTAGLFFGLASATATPGWSADKPRIAVIEFKAKADQEWRHSWNNGGAAAAQDVFVTELKPVVQDLVSSMKAAM